jgi:hypothetical protein
LKRTLTALALVAISLSPLRAIDTFSKILLPIALPKAVPGAFGSQRKTDLSFFNKGDSTLAVDNVVPCILALCVATLGLGPHVTFRMTAPEQSLSGNGTGQFVYADSTRWSDLVIHLRVRDLSRAAVNAGTEIPAVPESRAFTSKLELLAVPTAAPFRALVRIYDFDPAAGHAVVVRMFQPNGKEDALVSEQLLFLSPQANDRYYPGYAEVPVPAAIDVPGGVRIEIAPATAGLRFWAMASITNNDTQHVTLVTP